MLFSKTLTHQQKFTFLTKIGFYSAEDMAGTGTFNAKKTKDFVTSAFRKYLLVLSSKRKGQVNQELMVTTQFNLT